MISNITDMKFNSRIILHSLLLILVPLFLSAQEQRTLKTKVTDVLALLPAADNAQGERIYRDLVDLGEEGLALVTDGVRPNGDPEGVPFRYAVSLLTHYGKNEKKKTVEQVYLDALNRSDNKEVKAYFIVNLGLVGSNTAVPVLAGYLADKDLASPATGALETIGTKEAFQTLTTSLSNVSSETRVRILKSLSHNEALPAITAMAKADDKDVKKQALLALARIGDPASGTVLLEEAKKNSFKPDVTEATLALIEYLNRIKMGGKNELVASYTKEILAGTADPSQQHFRLAALKLAYADGSENGAKALIAELNRFDPEYRKEILKIAAGAVNEKTSKLWEKEFRSASGETQGEILSMLASVNHDDTFVKARLLPALTARNVSVRIAAAEEIGKLRDRKFASPMVEFLLKSREENEMAAARTALLQLIDKDNTGVIAGAIPAASPKHKIILLGILKEKRAASHFDAVSKLTASDDPGVRKTAYETLASLSTAKNIDELVGLIGKARNEDETKAIQAAIIAASDRESSAVVLQAYERDMIRLLPVLPYVDDPSVLEKVTSAFYDGNEQTREVAFDALANWQNHEAVRTLLKIRRDKALAKYHERAFSAFVSQVSKSSWTDDQKLLMLREIMTLASGDREKIMVLRAVGNLRTFLSLEFVAGYLDDPALSAAASRSAMQIALPTSDAKPGLTGSEVRRILQKMLDKLTGGDSQYERIDIQMYLDQLPHTTGFQPIFNGKDLTGWQGLVEDPLKRMKMSKEELVRKQAEADSRIAESWTVRDGAIWFTGDGANLCTTRKYGDFEMIVDWKISKNGDSGIYLRGSPQVQIWDTSRVDAGAQVGSGGLYNNKVHRSTPLVVADNPVGEWNTFLIRMMGEKVTVHLNGILVVDNVVMENYWDRSLPIFPEEAIELQAHGTELAFRDIFVRELGSKPPVLSEQEKAEGFEMLFNGKDLNNWMGNKTDYVVEDNTIAVYPANESHGNLSTEKEYSDFIFRFEFQLTPGANNGLGIHAPLEGDAAYLGKEIQILDNTASVYAKLEPWQYHGSVYGIIAAKREFLKPVGEWNQEEVYVKGDYIRVTLNGTVIAEGDLKKITRNGTLDKKEHPGLKSHKGHISFLGHGSVVKFRNIRIKELTK